MNENMLRDIDYLRERADITYEEAIECLRRNDGDVLRALIELERRGCVRPQPADPCEGAEDTDPQQPADENAAAEKAASFVRKAFQTHLVVEKRGEEGEKDKVLNVSAPIAAGILIAAPWASIAAAGIAYATGYQLKLEKEKPSPEEPSDAE